MRPDWHREYNRFGFKTIPRGFAHACESLLFRWGKVAPVSVKVAVADTRDVKVLDLLLPEKEIGFTAQDLKDHGRCLPPILQDLSGGGVIEHVFEVGIGQAVPAPADRRRQAQCVQQTLRVVGHHYEAGAGEGLHVHVDEGLLVLLGDPFGAGRGTDRGS